MVYCVFITDSKHQSKRYVWSFHLFNEGEIVWLDLFNINSNFALAVEIIFAVNKT